MTTTRAIALGGLTVGTLDALDAALFFGPRGIPLDRIFRGIAGGLLGRDVAVAGGTATLVLGVVLHFFIATMIVAVLVLAARRVPALVRRPLVTGPIYGILAWLVMNFVVIPLSTIGFGLPPTAAIINGLLIHMVGIGIPAALFARVAGGGQGGGAGTGIGHHQSGPG